MTDFTYSAVVGTTFAFNVANDTLTVGSANGSAAEYSVSQEGSNTRLQKVTYVNGVQTAVSGQFVILTGVTPSQLTTTKIQFTNGSRFIVGDNDTGTTSDDFGNDYTTGTLNVVTSFADHITGLGGNDTVNGGQGADVILGGSGSDSIVASADAGADTVFGNADNDTFNYAASSTGVQLYGGQGADTFVGSTGADTINGNKGADRFGVGAGGGVGTDTVFGGQDDDAINYGATGFGVTNTAVATSALNASGDKGNDTVQGGDGNDTLTGGDGNDSLLGGVGTDNMNGNAGDDTLDGGAGADTVRGGQGADSITSGADTSAADLIFGDKGADTVTATGATGADTISGGDDADLITLTSVSDGSNVTAQGDAGNDTLTIGTGNTGNHSLTGGTGDDVFNFFLDAGGNDAIAVSDYRASSAGTDTLNITSADLNASGLQFDFNSSTLILEDDATAATGNDERISLTLAGAGSITITNNTGGATSLMAWNNSTSTGASVTGGTGADLLLSLDAGDTLTSGDGADFVSSGAGADRLVQNSVGADTANGGTGSDTLEITGTTSVTLNGAAAAGTAGHSGFETITFSGSGTRTMDFAATYVGDGIAATDTVTINGASLSDVLTITDTGDSGVKLNITGGSANDSVVLNGTTTTLSVDGGAGNDTITGFSANDTLLGGSGNDSLTGAAGSNTITGGAGVDVVVGGAGTDTYRFATGDATTSTTQGNLDIITVYTDDTDKFMFQGVDVGSFSFSNVADTTADITLTAVLALNNTANSVVSVNLGNASQTGLGAVGQTGVVAAAGDDIIVVNIAGTKYAYFVDGAGAITLTAADFVAFV